MGRSVKDTFERATVIRSKNRDENCIAIFFGDFGVVKIDPPKVHSKNQMEVFQPESESIVVTMGLDASTDGSTLAQ